MPVGMIVSYIHFACERRADVSCHIGVGFCVARRTVKGNARALNSKTSNRYRLLRFFVFMSVSGEFSGKPKIMTMRAIIAISAFANRGKTTAIKTLAKRFQMRDVEYFNYNGDNLTEPDPKELLCRATIDVNGKERTIGFSSQGDSDWFVSQGLKMLTDSFEKGVDVMVVAYRARKNLPMDVIKPVREGGYEMIWTANYCGKNVNGVNTLVFRGVDLNEMFAGNMVSLINRLLP